MPSTVRDASVAPLKLVYLARLREALGTSSEEVGVPAGVTNAGALRAWLAGRGGAWATELAAGRAVKMAVNHEMAAPDAPVQAGDEVAFFPPVTGG